MPSTKYTIDVKHLQRVRRIAGRGVKSLAADILREGNRLIIDGPKTGRVYGGHQASAPGEAPANETGELVKSGRVVDRGETGRFVRTNVEWNAEHAAYMQFGTSKIAPRPFADIAAANVKQRGVDAIAKGLNGKVSR